MTPVACTALQSTRSSAPGTFGVESVFTQGNMRLTTWCFNVVANGIRLPALQYLPDDLAHELEDMLAHDGGAATIKINYRPYDWSANALEE